ncbi:MAG: hypothetical protein JO034_04930 [Singulisphaera sp.]|nr:hypothetical protein [Singulisphaera sp.]
MIDDPEVPRVGVVALDAQTACWRVWAPHVERVELVLGLGEGASRRPMEAEPRG